MKIKSLVLVALLLSMLFVLSVGVAAAAPGNPGPQPWAGKDGGNVWQAHDGAGGYEIKSGSDWGAFVSGRLALP